MKKGAAFIAPAAVLMGSCAPADTLETYEYVGIDFGTSITGSLNRLEGCYVVKSEIGGFRAVFPEGTNVEGSVVQLPSANGGDALALGRAYRFNGAMNNNDRRSGVRRLCPTKSFTINSVGDPR